MGFNKESSSHKMPGVSTKKGKGGGPLSTSQTVPGEKKELGSPWGGGKGNAGVWKILNVEAPHTQVWQHAQKGQNEPVTWGGKKKIPR